MVLLTWLLLIVKMIRINRSFPNIITFDGQGILHRHLSSYMSVICLGKVTGFSRLNSVYFVGCCHFKNVAALFIDWTWAFLDYLAVLGYWGEWPCFLTHWRHDRFEIVGLTHVCIHPLGTVHQVALYEIFEIAFKVYDWTDSLPCISYYSWAHWFSQQLRWSLIGLFLLALRFNSLYHLYLLDWCLWNPCIF